MQNLIPATLKTMVIFYMPLTTCYSLLSPWQWKPGTFSSFQKKLAFVHPIGKKGPSAHLDLSFLPGMSDPMMDDYETEGP